MERSFHILLYRAFHIQRKWVRARMQLLGVGAGQRARGRQPVAHAVQHGFQQPFQLFQNGRAAHAGDGDLVFQHEFVQSEPADAQNFFEIAHGAVRMDRESA